MPMRPLADRWADYPLLRLALPLMAGVAAGCLLGRGAQASPWPPAVAGCVLLAACLLWGRTWRPFVAQWAFGLTLSLAVVLLGCAYTLWRSAPPRVIWPAAPCAARGVVVEPPKPTERTLQLRLRLTDLHHRGRWQTASQVVQVTLYDTARTVQVATGDALLLYGTFETPRPRGNPYSFNYAAYLAGQGVSGTLFVPAGRVRRLPPATARRLVHNRLGTMERLRLRALMVRDALTARYRRYGLEGQRLAVASALTLGDRHRLARTTQQLYAQTGAAHILALSGLHLGILFGLLQALLLGGSRRRGRRMLAQGFILLVVWAFVFVAGLPTSLLRAAIMCSVCCLTFMFSRQARGLNALALAAIVLLLARPLNLLDVGFQMSFGAVFVILCLGSWLTPAAVARRPAARVAWSFVVVSLCAQLGVAPLVAYYFHNFTPYFLLTNLLAIPLAYAILATSLAFFATGLWPWAQGWVAGLLDAEIGVLNRGLGLIARLPHATVTLYPTLAAVCLFYLGALLLVVAVAYRRGRWLVAGLGAWGLMAVAQVVETRLQAPRQCIWFYNQGRLAGVHFIDTPARSYLWTPRGLRDTAQTHRRAEGIDRDFWRRFGLRPRLVGDDGSLPALYLRHGIALFGRRRVALLHGAPPAGSGNGPRLAVDVLYVCRGFRGRLQQAAGTFAPRLVVLDASLPPARRRRLTAQARELGWPTHDIDRQGALKLSAR